MKRKGFTLVELLVVIAIIALLMGILMPTLGMVRKMAQRAVCGSNLGGLYKAILTYAQVNKGDYPRAGGRNSLWGPTAHWDARDEINAFGEAPVTIGGKVVYQNGTATIGASLYQLIKHVDVGPKSFICKGDKGAKPFFTLSDFPGRASRIKELRDAWDFGGGNYKSGAAVSTTTGMYVTQYYSYAYHIPYGGVAQAYMQMSTQSQSRLAVLADRSPYLALSPGTRPAYQFNATIPKPTEATERWGNSTNHDDDGQNVLFNDGSVSFEGKPYCGVNADNIYTMASTTAGLRREAGSLPSGNRLFNVNMKPLLGDDSLLVNEGANQGSIGANL